MCQLKSKGGRCAAHQNMGSQAGYKRSAYASKKLYGGNTVENRRKVDELPAAFAFGTMKERAAVVEKTTDPEVLRLAALDKPAVLRAALRNELTDPEVLKANASPRPTAETFDVLSNPSTPAEMLEELTRTGAPQVRTAAMKELLKRDGVDLQSFVSHESPKIRAMVAARTDDLAVRDALLADPSTVVRERALLNDNFRDSPLPESVAEDWSTPIRELAARTTTDKATLRRLADDPDRAVAELVRKNPACPLDIEPLTASSWGDISSYPNVAAVASDLEASRAQIATAYSDRKATAEDRAALANHPNSSEVMRKNNFAALDEGWKQRMAESGTTDPKILTKLTHSRFDAVRIEVAQNPSTPPDGVEYLSRSSNPGIALAAASNPNLAPEVAVTTLTRLAKMKRTDGIGVILAAATDPRTPASVARTALTRLTKTTAEDAKEIAKRGVGKDEPKRKPEAVSRDIVAAAEAALKILGKRVDIPKSR